MNAGVIVDAPLIEVRFKRGRKLGTLEEGFASTLSPGDTFAFAGLSLAVERLDTTEMVVRATSTSPRIPTYGGTRLALSTNPARSEERRVRKERVRTISSRWPPHPSTKQHPKKK